MRVQLYMLTPQCLILGFPGVYILYTSLLHVTLPDIKLDIHIRYI